MGHLFLGEGRLMKARVPTEKILERAKGLEPSTPTLARSCSTTELHPHPRCRRSLAGNGRAMPNAARECNSANTVRTQSDSANFLTNWPESTRNRPKRAIMQLSTRRRWNSGQSASVSRSDSSHFSNEPAKVLVNSSRLAASQSKVAHHSTK